MKLTKKLVVLTAALAFATAGAFAQQRNTTTTTTTTTTYVEEYEETTGVEYVEEEMEEVETGTYVETRTYEAYVAVPVETTKESTYTVKQGKPTTTWSTADFIDPYAFHIYNVLSSDIIKLRNDLKDAEDKGTLYASEFDGLYEKVVIDYDAKRLKFQVAPNVALAEWRGRAWSDNHSGTYDGSLKEPEDGLNRDDLALFWNGLDWFVEVFPFDIISLDLHHDIYTAGSYLPVAGANVASGDLGSSGLTLVLYPIDNLRIAATAPFNFSTGTAYNFFNAEKLDEKDYADESKGTTASYKFDFGVGADYQIGNILTLGVTGRHILSKPSIGAHIGIIAIKNILINVGYTFNLGSDEGIVFDYWHFNDDWVFFSNATLESGNASTYNGYSAGSIYGDHVIDAAFGFDNGKLDLGLDVAYGISVAAENGYDLYVGLKAGYNFIADTLHAGIKAFIAFDVDNSVATKVGEGTNTTAPGAFVFGFLPSVTYNVGRSTFNAGVNLQFAPSAGDSSLIYVKFPFSWTYRFI